VRRIWRQWEVERQLRDLEDQIREENPSEKKWDWRRHYRGRQATINVWPHYWTHPATRKESETIDTFYVQWDPPRLYEIETVEGFSLEDLPPELGRLELNALGWVKHSHLPRGSV
jgi:hypothetical protein